MELTREDIQLFRKGDTTAFGRIYRCYVGKVYNFVSLYVHEPAEKADLVQDVFVRLWEKRRSIDPEQGLDGLLFILTRNMVLNSLRGSSRKVAMDMGDFSQIPNSVDVLDSVDSRLSSSSLAELIGQLPPRQRDAFILRHQAGLPVRDIAEKMGLSEKTVKRHLNLAMHFIKNNLP